MPDSDKGAPYLRVAAENDQSAIEKDRALRNINRPLQELASNILRVVRGAGKSYDIGGQCVGVIEAFQKYRDVVGCWPGAWEIDNALSVRPDDENAKYDDEWERQSARETIMQGGLQIAASRLARQRIHERRGESEMMQGVNDLEILKRKLRQRIEEEELARRRFERAETSARKQRRKRVGASDKTDGL